MNRRNFLRVSAATAGWMALSSQFPILAARGSSRPNIVLFLASDLGYGDLGCYGNRAHRTPNLDRLAREGIRFTDFHANGPMCSPSRAALLTGLYQQRVGLEYVLNHDARDYPPMDPSARTFGHALREAGYATGFFGCHHTGYLPENSPLRLGFDEFVGLCGGMDHQSHVTRWGKPNWWHGETLAEEKGYASDLITDHALGFIERNRDRPFCVHVADFAVHFPWQGPRDPPVFLSGSNNDTSEKKYGARADRAAVYREMVEAMDRNVGRLLDRLAAFGLERNTLFLFSSDHGGHHLVANNRPLSGAKGSLREGGHRVPTLARWPGTLGAGRVVEDTLMLMDLFPTFCDLCAARSPARLDGVSFLPLLTGGRAPGERTLFWRMGSQKAARRGPWKLLVEGGDSRLFDLASDLGEVRDLAAAQPALRDRLSRELAAWEAEMPAAPAPRARA